MNLNRNRKIRERWFICGKLELVTPTSLSNGDDDFLVDLPIVVDALDGGALLTGASLAGALRSYLMDFGVAYATALFGGARGNDEASQSALIVEDALGDKPNIELREGVSIDPATHTAREKERYDRQLLSAGTYFDLGFELIVAGTADDDQLKAALAQTLYGLQSGDIRLGGRKRRGYGQCHVISWEGWRYDLTDLDQIKGWLAHGRPDYAGFQPAQWSWKAEDGGQGILDWKALGGIRRLKSSTPAFRMQANLDIDGSVLIRSGFETTNGPDVAHLRSRRGSKDVPVMSGTSLAGVIRAQALRIARTLAGDDHRKTAEALIGDMFGVMEKPRSDMSSTARRNLKKQASRVTVSESVIEGQTDIVQTRVKIDRFTGGAVESALFAEQPAFGGGFTMDVSLRNPQPAEVGLLLLVLKDLWTGFIPVGGGSSVGRGRLKGREATIDYDGETWHLGMNGDDISITAENGSPPSVLNTYVAALSEAMQGE